MARGAAFTGVGLIRLGEMEISRDPKNVDAVKTVIFGDEWRCDEERQKRTQSNIYSALR
jgi:hypothetical protein